MFRFNNPDAMLVLLLVVGAYAMVRALERGSTWWLVFAFSAVGFGFLAKMLQALLVVPAFGLVYLIAAPVRVRRRVIQLTLACAAMVVSAGWWIAIVELWPAASRPYIGGSQTNSVLELIFGYNGFGRLTGNETGSVIGGGAGQAGQWGPTGLTRMFGSEFGTQISWLLPAALILLVAGLAWRGRRPRTDRVRAAFILWGGWLVVTGIVFSLGKGIIHPYYSVALAPAIGALVGMGAGMLWKRRHDVKARARCSPACWSPRRSGRTSCSTGPRSGTRGCARRCCCSGCSLAGALLAAHLLHGRALVVLALAAIAVALAAPAGYALSTVRTAHTGAIPSAGPGRRGRVRLRGFGGGPTAASDFGGTTNGGRPTAPRRRRVPGLRAAGAAAPVAC